MIVQLFKVISIVSDSYQAEREYEGDSAVAWMGLFIFSVSDCLQLSFQKAGIVRMPDDEVDEEAEPAVSLSRPSNRDLIVCSL